MSLHSSGLVAVETQERLYVNHIPISIKWVVERDPVSRQKTNGALKTDKQRKLKKLNSQSAEVLMTDCVANTQNDDEPFQVLLAMATVDDEEETYEESERKPYQKYNLHA